MKVLAIYAINEHIAELMIEAEQNRLARQLDRGPSRLARALDALRAAASRLAPASGSSPATA